MSRLTQEYFDAHARAFDSIYLDDSRFSRWFNHAFRQAVYDRFRIALQACGDLSGKEVLDIGCGSGRYAVEYAKRGASRVIGIDLSGDMLDLARGLAAREGVTARCEFRQGDFATLGFAERFDVVLAMGVFDYIEAPDAFLCKMAQVSRGFVISSFPGKSLVRMYFRRLRYRLQNCPVFFYSKSELEDLVRSVGFDEYKLVFMPHSGTGFVLVGRVR